MPPRPDLTADQTRQIEILLDLEPAILFALRNTPRATERAIRLSLSNLREWIAHEDGPQVRYDDGSDWYEITLQGAVIGYVMTTLYSQEGLCEGQTQLGFKALRPDRRMLKNPLRPTLTDAIAHVLQSWQNSDQETFRPKLVGEETATPEPENDADTLAAILAWIRVTTRRQGVAPTLGAASRAFGMPPGEVHALLTRPALGTLDGRKPDDPSQALQLSCHSIP